MDRIETALRSMTRDNGYAVFGATHVLRIGDEYFIADGSTLVPAGADEKIIAKSIKS